MALALFVFPATLLSTSFAESGHRGEGFDCGSWRLAVETNSLQGWKLVPEACEEYVGKYMLGKQYRHDCRQVADAAIEYANGVVLAPDGRDVWVFDIDETTLSNLPYFARPEVQFGAMPYNEKSLNEWMAKGEAPPVPAIRRLYKTVLSRGFKTVFLTGTPEKFKRIRIINLKKAGYHNWKKIFFRGKIDKNTTAVEYKSKKRTELVNKGYRIVGNVGDQWSDLTGTNVGNRTFKVPDPLYYIT